MAWSSERKHEIVESEEACNEASSSSGNGGDSLGVGHCRTHCSKETGVKLALSGHKEPDMKTHVKQVAQVAKQGNIDYLEADVEVQVESPIKGSGVRWADEETSSELPVKSGGSWWDERCGCRASRGYWKEGSHQLSVGGGVHPDRELEDWSLSDHEWDAPVHGGNVWSETGRPTPVDESSLGMVSAAYNMMC